VRRTENAEVPAINGKYFSNIQPLSHCYDTGIHEINIGVIVFAKYLGRPNVILVDWIFNFEV